MKIVLTLIITLLYLPFSLAQTITPEKQIEICDQDGDGFVQIPFSQLQEFALDVLQDFNQSPEIYVTKAHRGVEKITQLYNNPQVVNVCGDTDGQGGYYDIAVNSQKEIFVVRRNGVLTKMNPTTCQFQTIGQIHPNGQSVLALSFDHADNLYEGGWTSKVYRADAHDLTHFYLWHDFGVGNASGDFVQIGDFLYVAWTMLDGKDHLFKVTLGPNNEYVSHQDLGRIRTGTFGLAAEYGRLYGNTVDALYEIDLNTLETTTIKQNPNNSSAFNWWGAAGYHEALNIQISYHANQNDATTGNSPLSDPYINPVAFQTSYVYIRVHESSQNTTYIIPVKVIINLAPTAQDSSLTECKNPDTGLADFNLLDAIAQINPNPNAQIQFFNNLEDLTAGINTLPTALTVGTNRTVFVKVSEQANSCYGTAELKLIIPTSEDFEYDSYAAFCLGTETVLSVPDIFVAYEWTGLSIQDSNQNLNGPEVIVSQAGNYTLYVTDENGCSFSLPFEVVIGGSPVINGIQSNQDGSITVQVTPSGQYEYSLDGVFWQSSPTFYNLEVNDYEIHVRDLVGCYSETYSFTFIQIPNFISPNGDGINDMWVIRGMNQYPSHRVQIFDRYGKMFFDGKAREDGMIWNGKYMGRPVATGTYWYLITLEKDNKISGSITVRN